MGQGMVRAFSGVGRVLRCRRMVRLPNGMGNLVGGSSYIVRVLGIGHNVYKDEVWDIECV